MMLLTTAQNNILETKSLTKSDTLLAIPQDVRRNK